MKILCYHFGNTFISFHSISFLSFIFLINHKISYVRKIFTIHLPEKEKQVVFKNSLTSYNKNRSIQFDCDREHKQTETHKKLFTLMSVFNKKEDEEEEAEKDENENVQNVLFIFCQVFFCCFLLMCGVSRPLLCLFYCQFQRKIAVGNRRVNGKQVLLAIRRSTKLTQLLMQFLFLLLFSVGSISFPFWCAFS